RARWLPIVHSSLLLRANTLCLLSDSLQLSADSWLRMRPLVESHEATLTARRGSPGIFQTSRRHLPGRRLDPGPAGRGTADVAGSATPQSRSSRLRTRHFLKRVA